MIVFQASIEYFIGSNSGYGTVRSNVSNIASTLEGLHKMIVKFSENHDVKAWCIYEYVVDSLETPRLVESS